MSFTRIRNNIKRIIKCFKNVKYIYNDNAPILSKVQYAALNVGAITSEQNGYFYNSIETEPDKEDVVARLKDYYGVINSDSAIEILEWLLHRGHSVYFEAIRPIISNSSNEFNVDVLLESELDRSLTTYISHIKESLEIIVDHQIIKGASEFKIISIRAWDLGRLVLVARCCCDANYITEEQAWHYIMSAYDLAKEIYINWEEFAKGYIVGRCLWGGNDGALFGIISITRGLLKDDNSPWMKYPLLQNR